MENNSNVAGPECELSKKIADLKNTFYSENKKPLFFKSASKTQFATLISSEIGLSSLLSNSIFIIPQTNKIFFDYPLFKTYATQENYTVIVEYISEKIAACISIFGNYEVHANLDSFSVSACQRYKDVIQLFCNRFMNNVDEYSKVLVVMYIYNTPNMFHQISTMLRPFINHTVMEKIILQDKTESMAIIKNIRNIN